MSLFSHPPEGLIIARGQRLIRTAEECLKAGQVDALGGVIGELRRLEALYGVTALVGPAPSWLGRFDSVIQAFKETRRER